MNILSISYDSKFYVYADVVHDIKSSLARDWRVRITHIWREATTGADAMAKDRQ